MIAITRKGFISHNRGDRAEVDEFIAKFRDIFVPKALGANNNDELTGSTDTDYVMRRIREKHLEDSTVTIIRLDSCIRSRRYVEWEIKSSLRQGGEIPNGLIDIVLPSRNSKAHLPRRFKDNWSKGHKKWPARYYSYPTSDDKLREKIEGAYFARTSRAQLIDNSSPMMAYNAKCRACGEVH